MLTDTRDAYARARARAERAENEAAMDGIFAKMFPSRTIVRRSAILMSFLQGFN